MLLQPAEQVVVRLCQIWTVRCVIDALDLCNASFICALVWGLALFAQLFCTRDCGWSVAHAHERRSTQLQEAYEKLQFSQISWSAFLCCYSVVPWGGRPLRVAPPTKFGMTMEHHQLQRHASPNGEPSWHQYLQSILWAAFSLTLIWMVWIFSAVRNSMWLAVSTELVANPTPPPASVPKVHDYLSCSLWYLCNPSIKVNEIFCIWRKNMCK